MDRELSQGVFRVRRHGDGRVWITQPPEIIVPCDVAVAMAEAILKTAGVMVEWANPGRTIIRPHNGNGGALRR